MRQLEQGQRVAVRLGEYPIPHAVIEWPADGRREQLARAVVRQALRAADRGSPASSSSSPGSRSANNSTTDSACKRRATNASTCAEDRSSHWASSIKHSRGRSSAVSENRLSTARPTRNRSGCAPGAQPKRRPERIALRRRQPPEAAQHRPAQLMQAGEGKLHLRLDPRRPGDLEALGALGRVTQQRCLSYPRFAAQHQHRALPRPCIREQPVEPGTLGTAACQRLWSFETGGSHALDPGRALAAGEHGDDQYFAGTG